MAAHMIEVVESAICCICVKLFIKTNSRIQISSFEIRISKRDKEVWVVYAKTLIRIFKMTSIVAAKFYTTQQKNGFLALNNAAATSLGLKYEVKKKKAQFWLLTY